MTDWLLLSCVASFLVACGLGFMLWLARQADRHLDRLTDEFENERVIHHGECPWNLSECATPARGSGVCVTDAAHRGAGH